MITIFFGDPGSGKTSLMSAMAIDLMCDSRDFVRSCRRIVQKLDLGGYCISLPDDLNHLVFSDYEIVCKRELRPVQKSWEVDGFRLGLPNERHETIKLPPYSSVFLDEGQRYYNSRVQASLFSDFVSGFYEMHRHYYLNIYLTCQRSGLIELNIRGVSQRFIEIEKMRCIKRLNGDLIGWEWIGSEYKNCYEVDRYIESGRDQKHKGKLFKYFFKGDIFSCYNSYSRFPLFLRDCENLEAFDFDTFASVGYDVDSICAYNQNHGISAPLTYYNSKK